MTKFQTLQTIAAGISLCDCIVIQPFSISACVCVGTERKQMPHTE